jgi:periodic tryptophan protein 1
VWNINDDEENGKRSVSLVTSRDLGVVSYSCYLCQVLWYLCQIQGKVFSTVFSPDDPLTLAAAGSKAKLQIWDVGATFGARKAFGAKLREVGRTLKEKEEGKGGVIGVASDDEESDDGGKEE